MTANSELVDAFGTFLRRYYDEDIKELAQNYPNEQRSLYVDWGDIYQYDPDLADDYLTQPEQLRKYAEEALRLYDLPIDISLGKAHVRVTGLPEDERYGIGGIKAKHAKKYIGVEGEIRQISKRRPRVDEAAFECQLCGTLNHVPQSGDDFQEPHECQGCERQGPFQINFQQSEMIDVRKVRLKQPPEKAEGNSGGHSIDGIIKDDLAGKDGEFFEDHAGEDAILYGRVELEQRGSSRDKKPDFDPYLMVDAIEFADSEEDIDPLEYKERFEKHAQAEDAYQRFWDNIQPRIVPVGNWPLALQMATVYLFGSPRINPDGNAPFRGDIHFAIFGGPGLGKSLFKGAVAYLSPDCENRTATGISSDVGLTAAAIEGGFGDGDSWTLSPGILARAGDHVILDEIDKTDAKLEKINDALEGDQTVTVDKAGINAELDTQVGLFAIGNPKHGRFLDNDEVPFKEQIEIDNTLWSRFDGVIILKDTQDVEQDDNVAKGMLGSYREDSEREKAMRQGNDPDNVETVMTDRDVPKEEMKAWVQYARENVFPLLTDEVEERLREFYVDIREDNSKNPPTARTLGFGIRGTVAFARLRLSDTTSIGDAEQAIKLSKALLGQSHTQAEGINPAEFTEINTRADKDQKKRLEDIKDVLGDTELTISDIAGELRRDYDSVRSDLQTLVENDEVNKLANNTYELNYNQ